MKGKINIRRANGRKITNRFLSIKGLMFQKAVCIDGGTLSGKYNQTENLLYRMKAGIKKASK